MSEAPVVFISYSHDSPAHKQWVAELAASLRRSGINAVLDQWDLRLGDDVTRFMEAGMAGSDRVLVVCTDDYIRKADAGEGGVGYERLIVTAELVNNLGTNKFIPIVRNVAAERKTPIFLATRLYIDFSNEDEFDFKLEELLRELHRAPAAVKPPLGKNPFAVTKSGEGVAVEESDDKAPVLPADFVDPSEVYKSAVDLARRNDLYGWRQLVKRARQPIQTLLTEWRAKYEHNLPREEEALLRAVDEAVGAIAPLLVIALTGVESGREKFTDQRALIDEVYEIDSWRREGYTILVDLPDALTYVCQALHGATCLLTGQLELALDFADVKVRDVNRNVPQSIWRIHKIVGWPHSLGGDCKLAWTYISTANVRFPWLNEIFGGERDYRTALAAYYIALNVYELATDIAEGRAEKFKPNERAMLFVPLNFIFESEPIQQRALSLLLRNKQSVRSLWERKGVSRSDVERYWPVWISVCKRWAASAGQSFFTDQIAHEDFFKLID